MIYLLACYFLMIGMFALLAYLTMRRSIRPQYKAFIYGSLTFALLMGIFLAFEHYETNWKTASGQGQAVSGGH